MIVDDDELWQRLVYTRTFTFGSLGTIVQYTRKNAVIEGLEKHVPYKTRKW